MVSFIRPRLGPLFLGLALSFCLAGVSSSQPTFEASGRKPVLERLELTDNEKAANGPLPGDVSLYLKELACAEMLSSTPGYFSTINGAELADAQRSGVFPCATFLGSHTGANVVYAWRSEDRYQGVTFVNNRLPGELYLTGGNTPPMTGPVPPGPYVAKADATTGKQIWRTYLDNANISKNWIATTNLNILSNGKVLTAGGRWAALLDPDTGRVLKHTTLPTGTVPPEDISFKKVTVAPDGTIILVSQARPKGSTLQGSFAWVKGFSEGKPMQESVIVAVDPDTLKVLDWTQMPAASIPAHIVTTFQDKIAIYATAIVNTHRYFWDPKRGSYPKTSPGRRRTSTRGRPRGLRRACWVSGL